MAAKQAAKPAATDKTDPGKEGKVYYIVNPAGAIHGVTYEHARWRLAAPGWRSATPAEVAALKAAGGYQVHDKPIAPRWTPEPVEPPEPEEVTGEPGSGGAGEKWATNATT